MPFHLIYHSFSEKLLKIKRRVSQCWYCRIHWVWNMALSTEIWTPGSEEAPSDALQLQVRCLFFCSMVEGVNNFWSTTRMTSFSSFCAHIFCIWNITPSKFNSSAPGKNDPGITLTRQSFDATSFRSKQVKKQKTTRNTYLFRTWKWMVGRWLSF